jgi:uncharacterized membrane protein
MALIQTSLIWVAYAVAVVLLLAIASIFVFLYQAPRDRAASVTTICIFTTSVLLATVLLMPVDIALVSSTSLSSEGRKKSWATPERVDGILYTLKIVYYTLYSLDAVLCLLVVPFTYFWYEEYDEDAAEHGEQTFGERFWGAFKYTIAFIVFVVTIFLIGFFVPFAKQAKGDDRLDLDYFKHLLAENRRSPPPCVFCVWLTTPRWRARSLLCTRPFDAHWNHPLRLVYWRWSCAPSRCHDQVGSFRFRSNPRRQHCLATRVQPRTPKTARRPR